MKRKIRVLHVLSGYPTKKRPYSLNFVKSQIDSLNTKEIECTVFDIEGYKTNINYLKKIINLRKIISRNSYDIIHAHYSYCGLMVLLSGVKKPLVVSFMGSDVLGRIGSKDITKIRNKIDELIVSYVSKKADAIIIKSEEMKKKIIHGKLIKVIPNGVNISMFQPIDLIYARNKLFLDKSKFIVLFIGNEKNLVKNIQLAYDSFNTFKNMISNPEKVELLVLNNKPYHLMPLYYNACNCLLMTSVKEGSPNAIKESLACNLPIVSTDVGDVKKVINKTQYCYIVDFNSNSIAVKLNEIYKVNKRTNGNNTIQHLNENNIVRRIKSLYEKVKN